MASVPSTRAVMVRMPTDLYAKAAKIAAADDRSVSAVVRLALAAWVLKPASERRRPGKDE